jgi:DNA polymerase I-like protein with 3'-5' exonuclease and polymerase domains
MNFNINSTKDLQLLLFGGIKTTKEKLPVRDLDGNLVYTKKDHKLKIQIQTKEIRIRGLGIYPNKKWRTEKGNISVNEDTLLDIQKGNCSAPTQEQNKAAQEFATILMKIRGKEKQLSTYYDSTEELIYDSDDCVHPKFIHVETDTGRLSSKSPNAQNQPSADKSLVLQHFISRY